MSERRVLVQLDDDLVNRLDQLASEWGTRVLPANENC
jgi:predicted transcriptional regulator